MLLTVPPDSPERPVTEETEKKVADIYRPSTAIKSPPVKKKATDIRKPSPVTKPRPNKHNPDAYPILSDENGRRRWIKKFQAIATTQGLSNVLNPAYRPRERHAIIQFDEEQEFLFDVLCTCATLPEEQDIVRRYEHGKDAQGALQAIVNIYLAFERDLLDDICIPKLIELDPDVTFTGHLSRWVELVHEYNRDVLNPQDVMDDRDKKRYLQNFVDGSGLEEVKVCKAYQDYVQDIFSAAVELDDSEDTRRNQCHPAVDPKTTSTKAESPTIDPRAPSSKKTPPTVSPTTSTAVPPQDTHHSDSTATTPHVDTLANAIESLEKLSIHATGKQAMDITTEFRHDGSPLLGPIAYERSKRG